MAVEAGLVGAQGLELSPEGDVVQLLPLLQQPLQLFHLLLPLVDLACTRSKLLLLLCDGAGQSKGPPGIGVTLGDGLHLQVETMLSGPRRHPLGHRHPLEHACPQLEVVKLISKVLTFAVQDVLRL
jgi:hypothetical protein